MIFCKCNPFVRRAVGLQVISLDGTSVVLLCMWWLPIGFIGELSHSFT